MKFEIKNRWNGELIFSIETDNWKLAIESVADSRCKQCAELLEALQELYPYIHDTAMEGESGFEKAWLKCEAAIRKAMEEL